MKAVLHFIQNDSVELFKGEMDTLEFSTIYSKENNFSDFLFAFLTPTPFRKGAYSKRKESASKRANSFLGCKILSLKLETLVGLNLT